MATALPSARTTAEAFWRWLRPPEAPAAPAFADPDDAPRDVLALGEDARRLLENPVLALAFNRVEDGLMRAVKKTSPAELAQREEAYRLYWAAQQLKAELTALVGAATVAAATRR